MPRTVKPDDQGYNRATGDTPAGLSTAIPAPLTATPSLDLGKHSPCGAGYQPDQVWADPIAAAIEFEDEHSAMGCDGVGFDFEF